MLVIRGEVEVCDFSEIGCQFQTRFLWGYLCFTRGKTTALILIFYRSHIVSDVPTDKISPSRSFTSDFATIREGKV